MANGGHHRLSQFESASTIPKWPMTQLDQEIPKIKGSMIRSTLDIASGFWTIPAHPDDQHKLAITFGNRQYTFTWCPFSYANSPAEFNIQRAHGSERALERIPWAPGTERALERTLSAHGAERALSAPRPEWIACAPGPEWNAWAPGTERTAWVPGTELTAWAPGPERNAWAHRGRSGLWSGLRGLTGRTGLWNGLWSGLSDGHHGLQDHRAGFHWRKVDCPYRPHGWILQLTHQPRHSGVRCSFDGCH